jgi:hypothetical protein
MGTTDQTQIRREWLKCSSSFAYFVATYCQIYDATQGSWIPFTLWPGQIEVAETLSVERLVVALKARQLGMTWLVLCYILWKMIMFPAFTALVFSRREVEAIYLLSNSRLRGIYKRLPDWLKVRQIVSDSSHVWQLSNGSIVYGFPTSAGDSYTAGFAFVDEADLVPDLDNLMTAVKPTIDGGGSMVLLSRVDKSTPNSPFKRIYLGAVAHKNGWAPVFLPWFTRPDRTIEWYIAQKNDILARTGGLDDLYEQYPATDAEALKPPSLDRRLPYTWLVRNYHEMPELDEDSIEVDIPGLVVYKRPAFGVEYFIGADPAEGNPESDDSVAVVLNEDGEECAVLAGKIEPSTFAEYIYRLHQWYNYSGILPERNNHGHAVILALVDIHEASVLAGWDDNTGWMSSKKGKALMYTTAADYLRDNEVTIHNLTTFTQLSSISGSDLKAPEGDHDDYATAFALACCALNMRGALMEVGESLVGESR